MGALYVWGIILSLTGCTMSNLGVNLQKQVHTKLAKKRTRRRSVIGRTSGGLPAPSGAGPSGGPVGGTATPNSAPASGSINAGQETNNKNINPNSASASSSSAPKGKYYLQPMWILGFAMVAVGSVADLISFGFAPMSLLAPLGAMTLVINMGIAPCFGERLTRRDVYSTTVIFGGTVLSLVFGSKEEHIYTTSELLNLYFRAPFILYVIAFCGYLVFQWSLIKRIKKRKAEDCALPRDQRIESLIWPSLAGAFGAHSVLFAKSCTEIAKSIKNGETAAFLSIMPYAVVVGMGGSLFLQMRFLNVALKKADALFVVPVYQVCWVIMNTIVGMIYFQDLKTMSAMQIIFFFLGVLITLTGVYFLSGRKSQQTMRTESSALGDSVHQPPTPDANSTTVQAGPSLARSSSSKVIGPGSYYLTLGLNPHVPLDEEEEDEEDEEGEDGEGEAREGGDHVANGSSSPVVINVMQDYGGSNSTPRSLTDVNRWGNSASSGGKGSGGGAEAGSSPPSGGVASAGTTISGIMSSGSKKVAPVLNSAMAAVSHIADVATGRVPKTQLADSEEDLEESKSEIKSNMDEEEESIVGYARKSELLSTSAVSPTAPPPTLQRLGSVHGDSPAGGADGGRGTPSATSKSDEEKQDPPYNGGSSGQRRKSHSLQ